MARDRASTHLGVFAASCARTAIAPPLHEKAALVLLDALGLALIARDEGTTRAMRSLVVAAAPGANAARVWGDATTTSLMDAVAANAVAVHAHFHDDCDHSSWSHPGSLIVPAAIGVVESRGGTLEQALRAVVAGYSSMVWLGAQEDLARALIVRGVRTSPALGTVGAAAAAACALGLDAEGASNAVAMAASITGGTLEPVRAGSDEWRLQNAHAARGGLTAALLAAQGMRGAPNAFEGAKGMLHALAGLDQPPARWNDPPCMDAILGIYTKPWATLGDNMAPVRAAKMIHAAGVAADAIRAIHVRMWRAYTEYPGTSYRGPFDTTVQALASTAFATAAMLVYGDLEYDVSHARRADPAILRLAQCVTVEPTDEGGWQDATVEVTLDDGRRIVHRAAEAPRQWLFQNAATGTRVLESRMAACGLGTGSGERLARRVLDPACAALPIAQVLDAVTVRSRTADAKGIPA